MGNARCFAWDSKVGDFPFDCAFLDHPPPDARAHRNRPGILAQLIEDEILPRLKQVHSQIHSDADPPRPQAARKPSAGEAVQLAALLLGAGPFPAGEADVRPVVADLLARGLPLHSLLDDLLAPAARHLDALLEDDACDFVEATLALGRLQVIARTLCARLETEPPQHGCSILLLPYPGKAHPFDLVIMASAFREAGWSVVLPNGRSGIAAVAQEFVDVVGLSLACDVQGHALAREITALRAASCNPDLRVLVRGDVFARHPEQAVRVGADAHVADARSAPDIAGELLEMRMQAC